MIERGRPGNRKFIFKKCAASIQDFRSALSTNVCFLSLLLFAPYGSLKLFFPTEKTCGVAINRLLGRDRGNHLLKCCGFSKYSFTDKMDYSIFKENAAYSSGNENNKKVLENA